RAQFQIMRADHLAEIVAPLESSGVLLYTVTAVVSAEPRDVQVGTDSEAIRRINLRKGDSQQPAPQDRILRIAANNVVRDAEAEVVQRPGGKAVRDADEGNVSRPRTEPRNDTERASLKCIEDFPLIMRPAPADLCLRGGQIVESQQQLARIRAAHVAGA